MGRYTVLLLTSFLVMVMAVTGTLYISRGGTHDDVEGSLLGEITVLTTLPTENVAYLAQEYERQYHIRVNFVPLTDAQAEEQAQHKGRADMVLSDSRVLRRLAGAGWLVPYGSEHADAVSTAMKDANDFWIGTWYDPVVFCVNKDYMQRTENFPLGWQDLATNPNIRIGLTDFLAADSAANMYFFLTAQFGEDNAIAMLQRLHPHVVQYAKYLSTPVRMAGMGEVDLSVVVQSEALRYIKEGYPLKIVQPSEGTVYTLTGTGILLGAEHGEMAKKFADWLLTDEAMLVLSDNQFYFVPTNPATIAYKQMALRSPRLLQETVDYPKEKRQQLLDRWVKEVRINVQGQ